MTAFFAAHARTFSHACSGVYLGFALPDRLYLILAAVAERTSLGESLLGLLPLLIFLTIFYLFLRKSQNKNKGYMDRAMEHMDALEKKTDRVIELLEEIKKK